MGGEGGSRVHMAGKNYTLFLFFGGGGEMLSTRDVDRRSDRM